MQLLQSELHLFQKLNCMGYWHDAQDLVVRADRPRRVRPPPEARREPQPESRQQTGGPAG